MLVLEAILQKKFSPKKLVLNLLMFQRLNRNDSVDTMVTDPQPPPTPKISVTRADFAVGDVEEDEQNFQERKVS